MAKIDIEIFTNEIEKTYTILKQNLIMIDTVKQLIAQGNLSEEAIASLNTALSTTNTKLENLNTFTKQEFFRTNQNISAVETTQENMNNVMPTDINVDSNKHLILEHNGVEITGQNKRIIPVIAKAYDKGSNTYELDSIRLTGNLTISEYLYSNFYDIELDDSSGIYFKSRAFDENVIVYLDTTTNSNILTDQNTKTLFGNSLYDSGNIDLYNHIISIDINSGILLNIFVKASPSNLKVNSLNDLTTLLKAKENTIIECNAYNAGQTYTRNVNITGLIYTNSTWKYGLVYMTPQGPFIDNEELITTATINDVVTTI